LTSEKKEDSFEISPFVKSLSSEVKVPTDYDYKNDRADYLENKYK